MKINKKGALPIIAMIGLSVAVILIIILVVTQVSANPIMSSPYTNTPSNCQPKNLGVNVKGNVLVKDTAFWGVAPSLQKIDISSVKTPKTYGVFSEEFKVKVVAIDAFTNNEVAAYTSNQEIQMGGDTVNEIPYSLSFLMPDNDCNNVIDDFDMILKAKLITGSPGDVTEITKMLQFRSGRWVE